MIVKTAAVIACLLALASPALAEDPPVLPRLDLTPGAVLPSCTMADICPHERPGLRGPVSASLRKRILASYDATEYCSKPGACELDHSIPVELCGATVADNLWPESYLYGEGAHAKDWVENELHRRVCAREILLKDAQKAISKDWLGAFVKYGGKESLGRASDMKDALESELSARVSAGKMSLPDAQKVISGRQ